MFESHCQHCKHVFNQNMRISEKYLRKSGFLQVARRKTEEIFVELRCLEVLMIICSVCHIGLYTNMVAVSMASLASSLSPVYERLWLPRHTHVSFFSMASFKVTVSINNKHFQQH